MKSLRLLPFCMAAVVAIVGVLVCIAPKAGLAASAEPTVRELFSRLPVTIFENTPEGLSEEEKQELVDKGDSPFWLLEQESPDRLILLSRPFGETRVLVRVFRGGPGKFVVMLGTSGMPVCALELWTQDETGGLVPMQTPDDPDVQTFFRPATELPAEASPAVLFCARDTGLEAHPLFWGANGLVDAKPHFRVEYLWKDGGFVKNVTPLP